MAIPPEERSRSASALSFGAALVIFLVVLWGAGRSFDFTDEGGYYLSAVHPEEVPDLQTTYFKFGRILFAVAAHNIAATRALVAGLVLAATFTFLQGLRRFLVSFAPTLEEGGCLGAAAMTGSALAFSTSPLAPSYNLLNAICLLAIAGLVLQSAGAGPAKGLWPRSAAIWPLFFAACLWVGDFFIKFSTSAALAVLLLGFYLTTNRARIRQKALSVLLMAVLGLLLGVGYFLSMENFSAWLEGVGGTWRALTGGGYLRMDLIRYAEEFRIQLIETLWNYESVFTALFCAGGILLLFRQKPALQRRLAALALAIVVATGVLVAPAGLFFQAGRSAARFYLAVICALALAGGLTWLARAPGPRPRLPDGAWRVLPLLVLLAVLPFAGAFGTSNDINDNTIYQLAPWLALIALLLGWLAQAWQARWLPALAVLFVSAVALSQFAYGYIFNPYRVPGGRLAQTVPTAVGFPATILRLDPASHAFVDGARAQLVSHGFKSGDDIFAFFNLPGLVFALGGVSPGHPWYFAGDENSMALDAMRVEAVSPGRRDRAVIVRNGEAGDFLTRLRALGIDFPNGYIRCGPPLHNPLTNDVVEVWRPQGGK